ncbi:MAG: hypothetical protein IJZ00_00535, partial [Lachnospiraceae bacterium]|nr:hypothetical protein [Lachnospiraceae bacterium]
GWGYILTVGMITFAYLFPEMVLMAEILLGAVGTIAGVAGTIESIQNGEYWQAGFRGLTTFAIGAITISQAIRNWGRIQQGFSSIRNYFSNGNRGCVGGESGTGTNATSSVNHGFDTTRINIAKGPTRFSPSRNAGLQHVIDRHFSPGRNAGQFTISTDDLVNILGRRDVINTPGVPSTTSGQYIRIVDVGEIVGTIKPSIPGIGGQSTTWITIITDIRGNLITTYPCPAP